MKKFLYTLVLMVAFAITSCQKDNNIDNNGADSDMYSLTVGTDMGVATRAAGAAPALDGYKARYILEIYHGEELYKRFAQWEGNAANPTDDPRVFQFRLVTNQDNYNFLVWVDYTVDGTDLHYKTTDGLKEVSMMGNYLNNDPSRDAFFAVKTNLSSGSTANVFENIVCKRPFGQLNITTTDWDYCRNESITPAKIRTSFKAYNSFNVLNQALIGNEVDFVQESDSPFAQPSIEAGAQEVKLVCNYIFAPYYAENTTPSKYLVSPVIEFINAAGTTFTTTESMLSSLPIQRNWQTNVSGNLLTKQGSITVEVEAKWEAPNIDRPIADENITRFHILPNDPRYNVATGEYTIDPSKIVVDPKNPNGVVLVFDDQGTLGAFHNPVTIVIPNNMPAGVTEIIVDANMAQGTSFAINNATFAGTIVFKQFLDPKTTKTALGNLEAFLPSGSVRIETAHSFTGVTVTTKESTFTLQEGSTIVGNLNVKGGRAVIDGIVEGEIFASNENLADATVKIKTGEGYKYYSTSSITPKKVSDWYGFGASFNSLIGIVSPDFVLPAFLNINASVHYAGAYAGFDFNNQKQGFNVNDIRNIRYNFFTANNSNNTPDAIAQLKKELILSVNTLKDLENEVNKPINELKAELKKQVAKVDALVELYSKYLPSSLAAKLKTEVAKLKASVEYFVNLPSVAIPSVPNLPIATFLPAQENFEIKTLVDLIGTSDDSISDYITGKKPISIFMIVNLFNDIAEAEANVAELELQKDALEAKRAAALAELDTMDKPGQVFPGTGKIWGAWVPYSKSFGSQSAENKAKMDACNAVMAQYNAQGLEIAGLDVKIGAAKLVALGFDKTLEGLGLDEATIASLKQVITAITPYLATAADVLNTVATTVEKIQSYNPWEYPVKASYKTPLTKMQVSAKFEYATGKVIFVNSK